MPPKSAAFAVGRVRVLERTLLSRAGLERIIAAETVGEVGRILSELQWGDAGTGQDIEAIAASRVEEAYRLIRACSPEPDLTDCFLLKYDILNLKVLVKARMLGEKAGDLSECGTIPPELLSRCVDERGYSHLPPEFREIMDRIELRVAVEPDPLFVSSALDTAYGAMVASRARRTKNPTMAAYFEAWADMTNLIIALRVSALGKGAAFAKAMFMPGGAVNADVLAGLAVQPQRAYAAIANRPYAAWCKEALMNPSLPDAISDLERQRDNYLLSLIKAHRYEPASVLPLIGYLLAREREASAVRLVVAVKTTENSAGENMEKNMEKNAVTDVRARRERLHARLRAYP